MVSLQACLVKQRREKSIKVGIFVATTACYNGGLTAIASELHAT